MALPGDDSQVTPAVLQVLVDNHREFLAFVERRVGDRAAAEDILQEAFVRGIEKGGALRSEESARAWFYRVLRNAIVDRHRLATVRDKRLEALAEEVAAAERERAGEVEQAICACVARLVDTLKPEYAQALRRIELDGIAVKDFAAEAGITDTNAGVRVFRARAALHRQVTQSCGTCAEHGCMDCTCKATEG